MPRDRIAGIGFHHPVRNARPLTKRKIAIAHLVMTAALVLGIIIAATAVTFGMARAHVQSITPEGSGGGALVVASAPFSHKQRHAGIGRGVTVR